MHKCLFRLVGNLSIPTLHELRRNFNQISSNSKIICCVNFLSYAQTSSSASLRKSGTFIKIDNRFKLQRSLQNILRKKIRISLPPPPSPSCFFFARVNIYKSKRVRIIERTRTCTCIITAL